MSKEGVPIDDFDPKPAIQKNQETANWPYREEAIFWYGMSKEMDKRFFNGLIYPDGKKVPAPVIAFDDLRNKNTLACYDLFPDEYGILGKITFNTGWYLDRDHQKVWARGRYSQGETLCHEYVHLWQQIGRGLDPYRQEKHRRDTHNKEFVAKANELGIHPMPVKGAHTRIATPGSPIDILLKDMGIYPPEKAYQKPDDDKSNWADWLMGDEIKKGRSTLTKYECPDCGLKVRIGVKDDPRLVHDVCSEIKGEKVFLVRHDNLTHTIYDGKR